jgi:hypothetical protein
MPAGQQLKPVLLEEGWAADAAEALAAADWSSAAAVYEEEGFQLLPAEAEDLAGLHTPGTCWDSLSSSSLSSSSLSSSCCQLDAAWAEEACCVMLLRSHPTVLVGAPAGA